MSPTSPKLVKAVGLYWFFQTAFTLSVAFNIFAVLYTLFAKHSYTRIYDLSFVAVILYSLPIFTVAFNRKSGVYVRNGYFYAPTSIRNQWKILGLSASITQSILLIVTLISEAEIARTHQFESMYPRFCPVIITSLMFMWTTAGAYTHDDLVNILMKEIQDSCKEIVASMPESEVVSE